jgi:hypothetical protein
MGHVECLVSLLLCPRGAAEAVRIRNVPPKIQGEAAMVSAMTHGLGKSFHTQAN